MGEFVALNVADVDKSGRTVVRHGKGGKSRVVFVGKRTRRALSRYLRLRGECSPDAPLWADGSGMRLAADRLRGILRQRAEAAGVDAPTPHSFRRAFALTCLRQGMDIYSLQRLMGHADLTVLRRYLDQTQGDLRETHRRAGPVDNLS